MSKSKAKLLFEIGNDLNDSNKFNEAISCYEKSLELNPNSSHTWNNRGISLFSLEKTEKAIVSYKKSLEINRYNSIAYYNLAIAFHTLNRYEEAIDSYSKSISINPELIEAFYNKGYALQSLGKYNEALDCFLKFNKHSNGNDQDTLNNIRICLCEKKITNKVDTLLKTAVNYEFALLNDKKVSSYRTSSL